MWCKTLLYTDDNGEQIYKDKRSFDTLDEAILQAKIQNALPKTITKVVSYKCKECHKYHIGRGSKLLTEEYKAKLNKELDTIFTSRRNRERFRKGEELKVSKVDRATMSWDEIMKNAEFKIVGKIDLSKVPKK